MESRVGDEDKIYQGRLGRTSKTSVLISSRTGPIFPASVHTSVNVTEDPELREELLAGQLNRVACPFEPGRTYDLAIPLRYHDEERRLFVLLIPEALRHEEFKHRSEMLQELAKEREVLPEYVRSFHTVFSLEQLTALLEAPEPAAPELAAPAEPEPAAPEDEARARARLDEQLRAAGAAGGGAGGPESARRAGPRRRDRASAPRSKSSAPRSKSSAPRSPPSAPSSPPSAPRSTRSPSASSASASAWKRSR